MSGALAISALLHAVVVVMLTMKQSERAPPLSATAIEVRLENVNRPRPRPASREADAAEPPAPQTASMPAPSVAPESRPARDWSREIRDVTRARSASSHSIFVASPTQNAGFGQAAEMRLPALAAGFRPPPPGKTCGREAEFEVGMHKFTMPVSYPCHDKREEYRESRNPRPLSKQTVFGNN